MAKTKKLKDLGVISDLTGASIIGLDAAGNDARFPIANIVRSEKGLATPNGTPGGTRFAGETWLVSPSNYGSTFTNWGGVNVPVKVGAQYVSNARLVWNAGAWSLQYELIDAPTDSSQKLINGTIPDYLTLNITSGLYSSSAGSTNYQVNTSAVTSHTDHYPAVSGETFVFEGLAAALTAGNIGVLFNSSGGFISAILPSALVAITGGYKYTVPSTAGVANIGFNIPNADVATVKIQRGSVVASAKVKPELIDQAAIKTALLNNDAGFATLAGVGAVFIKESEIATNPIADYVSGAITAGVYKTSGSNFEVQTPISTSYSHFQYFAVTNGEVFSIEGLVNTLGASNIGILFGATGTPVASIAPASLVAITGGHKYTIPATSTIKFVGFNINNLDVPNYKIQRGDTILNGKIKSSLIEFPPPILPHLNIERFSGKKMGWFGDSTLTFDRGYATQPYPSLIASWLGMNTSTSYNLSKSGTGLVRPFGGSLGIVNRLDEMPLDIDFWGLEVSLNDLTASVTNSVGTVFANGLPFGTFADSTPDKRETTFFGALHATIGGLVSRFPLKSGIVTTFTPRGTVNLLQTIDPARPNNYGDSYCEIVVAAIKKVCDHYGIKMCNLFSASSLFPYNATHNEYYFDEADFIHMNNLGHYEKVAPKVFSSIIANL